MPIQHPEDRFVGWASDRDAEEWQQAETLEDAFDTARIEGLDEIWVDEHPRKADAGDVIPQANWIIDVMLDNSCDDVSTWYAAEYLGWLEHVTRDQEEDLDQLIRATVYGWLKKHGHEPKGFVMSGPGVRMDVPSR